MSNLITYAVVSNDYLAISVIKAAAKDDNILFISWTAFNFKDAITRFKASPVDILIFDLWVPAAFNSDDAEYNSGLEFARFLPKTEKSTKFILMSDKIDSFEFLDRNSIEEKKLEVAGVALSGVLYKNDMYKNGIFESQDYLRNVLKRVGEGEVFVSEGILSDNYDQEKPNVKFTKNEMTTIHAYCKLGSASKVAKYLGKKKPTVDSILYFAKKKAGVKSTCDLITKYYYIFDINNEKSFKARFSKYKRHTEAAKKNILKATEEDISILADKARKKLTEKELKILKIYIKGKKAKGVAKYFGIESQDVLNEMKKIRNKLRVNNSYDLFYTLGEMGCNLRE